jgi:hypothetical protein|tara:strand:- start:6 stop:404 length:399 start_codon:yes stop_codon:yes gene_type:complete
MKKILLSTLFAFATIIASAQILVVGTFDNDQEETVDKFTKNMGIGYMINDKFVVGGISNGDDFDLMGRYMVSDDLFVSLQMPTENSTDNMTLGVGYGFNVWSMLYIEPNYSMNLGDNNDDDGEFKIGFSLRF